MVSAQTADQKKFLRNYKSDKALYVEGPFFIWVRRLQRYFFTLRADAELDNEGGEGEIGTHGSKIGPGNDVVFQATFFFGLELWPVYVTIKVIIVHIVFLCIFICPIAQPKLHGCFICKSLKKVHLAIIIEGG